MLEATESTDATWTIRSVFKAAWEKQEGAKAKILLAGILYLLISFIVETCFGAILVATGLPEFGQQGTWHNLLMGLLVNLLMAPLLYGFWLLGINRSAGISINIKSIFEPLTLFLTLVGLNFLILFLTLMGTLLLIIPGIYLGISYALAPVLVIKKNMGIWESMETSRKTVTKYWWRFFGFGLLLILLNFLGAILFVVPLIWTVPVSLIAFGEVYNSSFPADEGSMFREPNEESGYP